MSRLQDVLAKVRDQVAHVMKSKGFSARLMSAPKLEDKGFAHGLPPGDPIAVMPVDALPGCPGEWVGGQGSYVCPVDTAWGLWFDWTGNDFMNTSVIASVKGMNPITGQKLESLALEQYEERCPVHGATFEGDERYCPKCEYKWPPQNYVCSPNTLWWDGFRQADGTVRQFFFSEDDKRDIASLVIGKQNTVPAFGFAFYEPKERRPAPRPIFGGLSQNTLSSKSFGYAVPIADSGETFMESLDISVTNDSTTAGFDTEEAVITNFVDVGEKTSGGIVFSNSPADSVKHPKMASQKRKETADVSVGAGAEIRQDLEKDPLKVSEWREDASALMRLYFVFAEQFEQIIDKGGIKDLEGDKEGFLKGLPVG